MSMRVAKFGMALTAALASTGIWAPLPPRMGWTASNHDGFCSLRRVEETGEAKLEFVFVSGLANSNKPKQITFQVNASPAKLVRPVRLSPGSDATAPDIEIGALSDSGTTLAGAGVYKLIEYLKAGKGLDVEYSLTDGPKLRLYLDTFNFPQSVAMFEACTAHVA
jgi:hypothetical protein